ncbi:MAG: hypothetical protein WB822_20060 [Rhodoplanes sp.]
MFAVAVFGAVIASLSAAQAEKRIFIIANNSDGYGIDRCLASGAQCGTAAATAFCRGREYAQAVSFRKADREEITGSITNLGGGCRRAACADFVAIECTR